jgi:hypothetical protein
MCVKCKTEHEQIKILNLLNAIAIVKKLNPFLKKKENIILKLKCVYLLNIEALPLKAHKF